MDVLEILFRVLQPKLKCVEAKNVRNVKLIFNVPLRRRLRIHV